MGWVSPHRSELDEVEDRELLRAAVGLGDFFRLPLARGSADGDAACLERTHDGEAAGELSLAEDGPRMQRGSAGGGFPGQRADVLCRGLRTDGGKGEIDDASIGLSGLALGVRPVSRGVVGKVEKDGVFFLCLIHDMTSLQAMVSFAYRIARRFCPLRKNPCTLLGSLLPVHGLMQDIDGSRQDSTMLEGLALLVLSLVDGHGTGGFFPAWLFG
jgi:hypothetical protein